MKGPILNIILLSQ